MTWVLVRSPKYFAEIVFYNSAEWRKLLWTVLVNQQAEEIISPLRVNDPSLSLSHYISTIMLFLPNRRDLNSCVNPEPQLKV